MGTLKLEKKQWLILLWILLFVFQDALTNISSVFSYIDEAPVILFLIKLIVQIFKTGKVTFKKENRKYIVAISLFAFSGLVGNMIFHYQPLNLVLIDLIANLKFWGAIAYFSGLVRESDLEGDWIPKTAKYISIAFLLLFLIDRAINIFPAEYRYGMKSAILFYAHPTYLAGICAFLIAILSLYDTKKYGFFIATDLILLIFTLRSKAIASAIIYVVLYVMIKKLQGKLKTWQMVVVGVVGVACAWSQINFYFFSLAGQSARSVMLMTSLLIIKDYFPIGTGFGTFASHSAAVNYSPVYIKYGFELIYELRNSSKGTFFDDQFWPIIFGQTGLVGTVSYIYLLVQLFRRIQGMYRQNQNSYMAALFVFIYLMISSIAEPAFNNSVAIPLAMALVLAMKKRTNKELTINYV